jgi:hypothetical protein
MGDASICQADAHAPSHGGFRQSHLRHRNTFSVSGCLVRSLHRAARDRPRRRNAQSRDGERGGRARLPTRHSAAATEHNDRDRRHAAVVALGSHGSARPSVQHPWASTRLLDPCDNRCGECGDHSGYDYRSRQRPESRESKFRRGFRHHLRDTFPAAPGHGFTGPAPWAPVSVHAGPNLPAPTPACHAVSRRYTAVEPALLYQPSAVMILQADLGARERRQTVRTNAC